MDVDCSAIAKFSIPRKTRENAGKRNINKHLSRDYGNICRGDHGRRDWCSRRNYYRGDT